MRFSQNKSHNNIFRAAVAAAVLACGVFAATSHAQDQASVKPGGADSQLAARVKQALQSDSGLNSTHIDVGVKNGEVLLEGFVQDNRALLTATQVATKAAGNHKVVNNLTIKQNAPNAP